MSGVQELRLPGKQAVGAASVAVLHLLVVYGLASGLGRQAIEIIRQPLEARIIEEARPTPPKPSAPPLKLVAPPTSFVPPPEIRVQAPPPAAAIQAVTVTRPTVVEEVRPASVAIEAPAPVAAEPVRQAPVIEAARSCRKPEYPPASRRQEETGTVVLQFLVDVDGRVIENKVESSSGYSRLDAAARDALSLCQFRPGTVDGRPERAWARLRYTWKLD